MAAKKPGYLAPKVEGKIRGMGSDAPAQDLQPLCKQLRDLLAQKDVLAASTTQVNGEIALLNDQLVEKFQQGGLTSAKMEGLGTFYIQVTPRPKVADEEALFKDLRRRKMGDLIKETVHPSTLTSTIKELRENGEADLAGVDIFEQTNVRMRKA